MDVVVTSPPYNIKMNYGEYEDNLSECAYLQFIREVVIEIYRVLKDDGSFFLNIGSQASNKELEFRLIHNIITPYNVSGNPTEVFQLQNHVTWVKSIAFEDDARGHYKPINSPRFLSGLHESVYHLTKK